ncbi:glycosyltransferase family protein [Paraburkholderia bannensis]|uniref:glycosyltransferase family 1 protein n=1 Tax=Paraburkholderia bannensis TaxID=765414 RepID=UPI002AC345F3|nr:glycosyltransferase family 1 protein [Paraburkholderia bannensis]
MVSSPLKSTKADESITPSPKPGAASRSLVIDGTNATSCAYHRLVLPFSMLDVTPRVPVFVFNRHPVCGVSGLIRLREQGVRIVADVDDLWMLERTHYLSGHYTRDGITRRTVASLALADVVMVTNEALADQVRMINREIVIVPNALPFDSGQFTRNAGASPGNARTPFVYAAGASHHDDIAVYRAVFEAGGVTLAGVNRVHPEWGRILKLMPRVPVTQERPVTEYMGVYDGHAVALAPLVDTAFNRCKSNIKTLEAGCKAMPIITSRVHPYLNARDRDYVLYAESAAEMRAHMDRCARDRTFVKETGEALAAHVRRCYSLPAANEVRRQVLMAFA